MPYHLQYHPDIPKKDLPSINKNIQNRIRRAIEQRLVHNPVHYGAPLKGALKYYRKLRVGDYRVIYEIQGDIVRIYTIGHRKEVYDEPVRGWRKE